MFRTFLSDFDVLVSSSADSDLLTSATEIALKLSSFLNVSRAAEAALRLMRKKCRLLKLIAW